jgi:hypothetical protein
MLRGSFGRGEGSVMVENGQLRFLSDYEINVATYSPFHRNFFARLARELSAKFGVETSIVWMRPDVFYKLRLGPFAVGSPPVTISLYETRYGSRILFGENLLNNGPVMDAQQISLSSGIQLILNRMAEAMHYIPPSTTCGDELHRIIWLNKLILACIESLLLAWGQYHFSYEERGRRFSILGKQRLDFMGERAQPFLRLAETAVEFKLRPRRGLYPEQLQETSQEVLLICDLVFRYLICRAWGLAFNSYDEFPKKYLQHNADESMNRPLPVVIGSKFLSLYKYVSKRHVPLRSLGSQAPDQLVYSIVPLLFMGWITQDETLSVLLREVRRNLVKVCALNSPASDPREEWTRLNEKMFSAWKDYCY